MAVNVNNIKLKKCVVNNNTCKKIIVNGTTVWSATQTLSNSTALQWNGPYYNQYEQGYATSSVRWDCRGYDTLKFNLNHSIDFLGGPTVYMKVTIYDANDTALASYEYNTYAPNTVTEAKTINISGLTEQRKNRIYMQMFCYGICNDWTGIHPVFKAQCTNVVASN